MLRRRIGESPIAVAKGVSGSSRFRDGICGHRGGEGKTSKQRAGSYVGEGKGGSRVRKEETQQAQQNPPCTLCKTPGTDKAKKTRKEEDKSKKSKGTKKQQKGDTAEEKKEESKATSSKADSEKKDEETSTEGSSTKKARKTDGDEEKTAEKAKKTSKEEDKSKKKQGHKDTEKGWDCWGEEGRVEGY